MYDSGHEHRAAATVTQDRSARGPVVSKFAEDTSDVRACRLPKLPAEFREGDAELFGSLRPIPLGREQRLQPAGVVGPQTRQDSFCHELQFLHCFQRRLRPRASPIRLALRMVGPVQAGPRPSLAVLPALFGAGGATAAAKLAYQVHALVQFRCCLIPSGLGLCERKLAVQVIEQQPDERAVAVEERDVDVT